MDDLAKIRDEMQLKGLKELPNLPDMPSRMSIPSFISTSRSPSKINLHRFKSDHNPFRVLIDF